MMKFLLRRGSMLLLGVMCATFSQAQFLMDIVDTTTELGKSAFSVYQRFDRIHISGYLQPQFQVAAKKGAASYNGGDFEEQVNNRFMIRRGRIRFDYIHYNKQDQPTVHFVFQFDGTERGVFIRDFWGRVYENNWQLFSITSGMFARPFGYEINLSSADRETPERGRMSQILMKTERDLGAMLSFSPRKKDHPLRNLKWDAGFFNGQGLTSPNDFDSYKDFITRISLQPYAISKSLKVSGGLSLLYGGMLQTSKYTYTTQNTSGGMNFVVDSATNNIGKKSPRNYYGADIQLKWLHPKNKTEFRAEYWQGKQTSGENTTETPASLPLATSPYFIRNFNGAFFYLLHTFHSRHQLGLKYDWYDPNTKVAGNDIGKTGTNINTANIKYSTLGLGYTHFFNPHLKFLCWYEWIKNESTAISAFYSDVKDNVLTFRLQFRF